MRETLHKNIKLIFGAVLILLLLSTSFSNAVEHTSNLCIENNDIIQPVSNDVSYQIRIQAPNIEPFAYQLESNGFDVQWGTMTPNSIELIVTPYEYNLLENQGYTPLIISKGRPFREIQAEYSTGRDLVPSGYLDLSEIYDEIYAAESDHPSICKVVDLTTTYNVNPTFEGRHLYAVKISDNVEQDEDEPTFLMVSCHHCREIVTPVIALYAIEQLTSNYGSDPQITTLVDDYEIWISPVWNPDGYEHVFNVDNMWRKNRHYFPEYGSYGVDLNRNYPFGWNGGCSGSTDPFSETYKGQSVASEAETQTMIAFSNDQHFTKVIDYHSYGREVLWGYHPSCHTHPFDSFLQSEAIGLSTAAGYGGSVRYASAEGENYQWQLVTNGTYSNLMETHTSFQPSYSSAQAESAQVWPSTIWMLERPISLSGHVIDSHSGQPLVATISLSGITFPNGEDFKSERSFGRYHMFLPPGDYTVEFSAAGYVSQSHQITVTSDSAEILEITLDLINDSPDTPSIDGPTSGKAGSVYKYTFETTDPDSDDVYYYIDWGDETFEEWIGPYDSGEQVIVNHGWSEQGAYTIKAKAKDVYDAESEWGTLEIEMPISYNLPFFQFFKKVIEHFPILGWLISFTTFNY